MSAAHNAVGKQTEQMVARWLRDHGGYPHAERTVRTGYRTAAREVVDAGDIDGVPYVVQVKSLRPADRMEREVPGWLVETERQRQAAGTRVGLLIVRRWGTTDVGRWWAFLPLGVLTGVSPGWPAGPEPMPARLEVRHAVALIRARLDGAR